MSASLIVDVSQQDDTIHTLITLRTHEHPKPLDIIFLVEASIYTLSTVNINIKSLMDLLPKLLPEDTISVIAFNSLVREVIPLVHINQDNISLANSALSSIFAGGTVDINLALDTAVKSLNQPRKNKGIIILLSNGYHCNTKFDKSISSLITGKIYSEKAMKTIAYNNNGIFRHAEYEDNTLTLETMINELRILSDPVVIKLDHPGYMLTRIYTDYLKEDCEVLIPGISETTVLYSFKKVEEREFNLVVYIDNCAFTPELNVSHKAMDALNKFIVIDTIKGIIVERWRYDKIIDNALTLLRKNESNDDNVLALKKVKKLIKDNTLINDTAFYEFVKDLTV